MAKREQFELTIQGYTPETLPMARLAEYLTDLAALLGEPEHVHFLRVDAGSAALVHVIEETAAPKVRARVERARVVDSDTDERRAFERIDHKLRDDNASAELRVAGQRDHATRLLTFPGRRRVTEPVYGPFNQPGQLQGTIIQIGGSAKNANVNIEDEQRIYYCEASRDVAVQLAPYLYQLVRVEGTGRYLRNADGEWEMKTFRVSTFQKLEVRSLTDTVERLRTVSRRVGLPRDIVHRLAQLRNED